MTDHLPECPAPMCDWGDPSAKCMGYEDCHHLCCCAALRACEQRVEEAMDRAWTQTVALAVAHTRTATLDAAREAVDALIPTEFWSETLGVPAQWWVVKADAISAIDVLREKP